MIYFCHGNRLSLVSASTFYPERRLDSGERGMMLPSWTNRPHNSHTIIHNINNNLHNFLLSICNRAVGDQLRARILEFSREKLITILLTKLVM